MLSRRNPNRSQPLYRAGQPLLVAAVLVLLINVPFWILSLNYSLERPFFNADATLALAGGVFGALPLLAGLVVVWILDLAQAFSLAYHFQSPADFLASIKYAHHLNAADFISWRLVAVSALFAIIVAAMVAILRRYKLRLWALLAITALLTAIDVVNGSGLPALFGNARVHLSVNVQGSPLLNLMSARLHAEEQAREPMTPWPQDNSTQMPDVYTWAEHNPDGTILLILVESWGWHSDPALRDWTARALHTNGLLARFRYEMKASPFRGSTTAGELRTLCNLMGHYSRLKPAQAINCLPARLAKLGFESIGLHGFRGHMFDRHQWWPTLGLTRSMFLEDLPPSVPRCGGALKGVCDEHLLALAEAQLGPRRMVYALTLGTHLPLEFSPLPADLADLCRTRGTSEAVCQLTAQLHGVLDDVSAVISRTPGPALVVIAGDHSPPFLRNSDREAFSATSVPLAVITSR